MSKSEDACLASNGAKVILATSSDEKHPPEHIIDGNSGTCWTTTGMFPQEFIISLRGLTEISTLTVQSYLVKRLRIERSTSKDPSSFELCDERTLEHIEGQLQTEEFKMSAVQATYLRFLILSGFDHFVAVYKVTAD
ncbi:intraflagellar transport protein 25 homolog [Ambystoma mexicanum]|uniref:intraflagellar transport protein 25 homolog n=1 Tax=Ambystoma mexicanum TaxID=8296 RepID=UPI0037E7113D